MKTAVSTKGQIVIPAEIRQQDEIEPGQEFEIERVDRGEYLLRRLSPPSNQGLLDWLNQDRIPTDSEVRRDLKRRVPEFQSQVRPRLTAISQGKAG